LEWKTPPPVSRSRTPLPAVVVRLELCQSRGGIHVVGEVDRDPGFVSGQEMVDHAVPQHHDGRKAIFNIRIPIMPTFEHASD
jgi:hypothetical protein